MWINSLLFPLKLLEISRFSIWYQGGIEVNYFAKICCVNQLTGFYMRATLALNGLILDFENFWGIAEYHNKCWPLQVKWSFPLWMSSANENNFTGNWGFVHIYDRILSENNSLFVQGLPNKLKTRFLYLFLVEILPSKTVRFHRFVLSFDPGIFHLSTCVSNCTKTEAFP